MGNWDLDGDLEFNDHSRGMPSRWLPPTGYLVDVLAMLVFGVGLCVMVAPLTTVLMASVPEDRAGLASAINNAIARVGSPLAGTLVFVFITASFYGTLAAMVPGLDPADPQLRELVSPLNPPSAGTPATVVGAAREASTQVFHLAMRVGAVLMFLGAIVAAVGILDPGPTLAAASNHQPPSPQDGEGES